jgi:hypothetical protein
MDLHRQCPIISERQWLQSLESSSQEGAYKTICNLLLCGWQEEFLLTKWEKGPVLFSNLSGKVNDSLDHVFSKSFLTSTCGEQSIPYGNNMNVVKYTSGIKTSKEYPFVDRIDANNLTKLFKKGYTVQFFQPQRFSDKLHSICAGFEYVFGTLAGASAYLTPPNTQGLAPHWDDVEVFIIQTEGKKLWHLWKPTSKLSESYSHDLARDVLGSPDVEVTLSPGDVLYLPRGTIHEAIALNTFSTHVTVSVYQKYNVKCLIEKMVPHLLEKLFERCDGSSGMVDVRRGLPIQMSSLLGTGASHAVSSGRDYVVSAVTQLSALPEGLHSGTPSVSCSELRDKYREYVTTAVTELGNCVTSEIIDIAADSFGADFCLHRLPEPQVDISGDRTRSAGEVVGDEQALSARLSSLNRSGGECLLRICDPRLLHFTVQEVDGVNLLLIGSGRGNSRMNHMGHPSVALGGNEGSDEESLQEEEEEEEEEEDVAGDDDWVQLSLPCRAYHLVAALSRPFLMQQTEQSADEHGFVGYAELVDELKNSFDDEEVRLDRICKSVL